MIAVLDACVLYPPALRDLLMWLAVVKAYEPRWSDQIHSERMRSVLADRPDITVDQLNRTRRLMDAIAPESLVSGHEAHIPSLWLPDADDRHVLAAAIEGRASVIVSYNLSDFPHGALAPHGVHALHPDRFLVSLMRREPSKFVQGMHKHRDSLRKPPKSEEEYIATLRALRLSLTARRLQGGSSRGTNGRAG